MADVIPGWTVRVLEGGLPTAPEHLEPGRTHPVAVWRGRRAGAVLFVRRLRNGRYDSECAITERDEDGRWVEPWAWGGGGWVNPAPRLRPGDGWDGEPVLWMGESTTALENEDGSWTEVVVAEGIAARRVAALRVEAAGGVEVFPVDGDSGAFLVGVEVRGTVRVVPLDARGDALGEPHEISS